MADTAQAPEYDTRYLKRQPTRAEVLAAQALLKQSRLGRGTTKVKVTPGLKALAAATPSDD